jgi:hypothetical protein
MQNLLLVVVLIFALFDAASCDFLSAVFKSSPGDFSNCTFVHINVQTAEISKVSAITACADRNPNLSSIARNYYDAASGLFYFVTGSGKYLWAIDVSNGIEYNVAALPKGIGSALGFSQAPTGTLYLAGTNALFSFFSTGPGVGNFKLVMALKGSVHFCQLVIQPFSSDLNLSPYSLITSGTLSGWRFSFLCLALQFVTSFFSDSIILTDGEAGVVWGIRFSDYDQIHLPLPSSIGSVVDSQFQPSSGNLTILASYELYTVDVGAKTSTFLLDIPGD